MWAWAIGLAAAQERTPFVAGTGWELLPVAETRWLDAAFTTTGQTWGAAGVLERELFPLLSLADDDGARLRFAFQSAYVYDALRLPADCSGWGTSNLASEPYCTVHVDAFASTGAVAYGNRRLALFYAASLNGLYAADIGMLRGIMPAVMGPYSVAQMYSAPFSTGPLKVGPGMQDLMGMANSEYVVGLRGEVAGVSGHAGFLGSDLGSGLYTNLTHEQIRLLATAVVRTGLQDVPLLQAGLVRSTIPALLGASAAIRPSLFVRKLRFDDPFVASGAAAAPATEDRPGFALWTGHAGTGTAILDVDLAAAWAPRPQLHELHLSLHTPNFDPRPRSRARGRSRSDSLCTPGSSGSRRCRGTASTRGPRPTSRPRSGSGRSRSRSATTTARS
jgi:hypothetical protein